MIYRIQIESKLKQKWGSLPRTLADLLQRQKLISNEFLFEDIASDGKCYIAELLIEESCPRIGAFSINDDGFWFIHNLSLELNQSSHTDFDGRRKDPNVFALKLLNEGMAERAVATVYLLSQLEYLFRKRSIYLEIDGSWNSNPLPANTPAHIKNLRTRKRINNIADSYEIFLLNNSYATATAFNNLEQRLPKSIVSDIHDKPLTLETVGKRLGYFRNLGLHGQLGDISGEGYFAGILMALFFYS